MFIFLMLNDMLIDLTTYICPQLFVLFKYHLKTAPHQCVVFKLDHTQSTSDIEGFLKLKQIDFKIKQCGREILITVNREPSLSV